MYGICGQRSDGKVLNCPNETRAAKVIVLSLIVVVLFQGQQKTLKILPRQNFVIESGKQND